MKDCISKLGVGFDLAFLILRSWFGQHWIDSELDNVMVPLCPFVTHILPFLFLVLTPPLLLRLFQYLSLSRWAGDF